jgi:hypothetical protein
MHPWPRPLVACERAETAVLPDGENSAGAPRISGGRAGRIYRRRVSDDPVSRRGLLTAALSRVRLPDPPEQRPPHDRPRPVAWGRGDSDGLLDSHAVHLLARVAHVAPEAPVLVVGTGDPALGRRLREVRATAVTEIHETTSDSVPPSATRAPLSDLPVAGASFGAVVSACGPMFARSASAAHAELLRVAAPGAPVVFSAWTGSGAVGRLLKLVARHAPPADGRPAPLTWGREERLRQDLDAFGVPFTIELVDVVTPVPRKGGADTLLRALGARDPSVLPSGLHADALQLVDQLVERVGGDPAPLRSRVLVVRTEGSGAEGF